MLSVSTDQVGGWQKWALGVLFALCMFLLGGAADNFFAQKALAAHVSEDGHRAMVERVEAQDRRISFLETKIERMDDKLDMILINQARLLDE